METILITGANRGIGLELTRRYLASGRRVVATCRNPEAAGNLMALRESGAIEVHQLDVTDDKQVAKLAASLAGRTIDLLINNAGIMGSARQSIDDMDFESWLETFNVNTLAPFKLITALRANLLSAERPRAVALSSQMGSLNRKSKGAYAYRSSKAALNKVMQVLSLELEADGVVVCPVHPGWVRTDMGGDGADISVTECCAGLMTLFDALSMEHSGRFWTWNGEEHPW